MVLIPYNTSIFGTAVLTNKNKNDSCSVFSYFQAHEESNEEQPSCYISIVGEVVQQLSGKLGFDVEIPPEIQTK